MRAKVSFYFNQELHSFIIDSSMVWWNEYNDVKIWSAPFSPINGDEYTFIISGLMEDDEEGLSYVTMNGVRVDVHYPNELPCSVGTNHISTEIIEGYIKWGYIQEISTKVKDTKSVLQTDFVTETDVYQHIKQIGKDEMEWQEENGNQINLTFFPQLHKVVLTEGETTKVTWQVVKLNQDGSVKC